MSARDRVDAYQETVKRLEPDIAPIDASAFYASAAISLRRSADAQEDTARVLGIIGSTLMEILEEIKKR